MYLQFLQDNLSENAPEVISESRINIFIGSMPPDSSSLPCAYVHGWGVCPPYFGIFATPWQFV